MDDWIHGGSVGLAWDVHEAGLLFGLVLGTWLGGYAQDRRAERRIRRAYAGGTRGTRKRYWITQVSAVVSGSARLAYPLLAVPLRL